MNVLIIDNGTKHLGRLKELLGPNSIVVKKLFSNYSDLNDYDIIILSGGSQFSVTNAPEIFEEEFDLVAKSSKPIIGICQGCEIIAYSYDCKLEYITRKARGIKTVTFTDPHTIEIREKAIRVYEAHHWAITNLGNEMVGLAKSKTGFEIVRHKYKKVYGLQFHPEMAVDQSLGDEVFLKILESIII